MNIDKVYKYCPRCSASLENLISHLKCNQCGLNFYLNPKPCTAIILQNELDEYLFVERAVEPKKGYWDFPGGFTERNENSEKSIKREVKEEIDIEIEDLKYIGSATDMYLYQEIGYDVLCSFYTGKVPKDAVLKPQDDVASYKYFKLEDFPLDKLSFPSMNVAIQMITKRF
jgi:NAD+ diphosphatase